MAEYEHLHLRGIGERFDFKGQGGGRPRRPSPVGDRPAHAGAIRQALDRAVEGMNDALLDAQNAAGVPEKAQGVTLAVASRRDERIAVGDMHAGSPGLQLLSRARGGRPGRVDRAVLFMQAPKVASVFRDLEKYASWVDGESRARHPRRFYFFESVDGLRPATPDDLWTADRKPDLDKPSALEVWLRPESVGLFRAEAQRLKVPVSDQEVRYHGAAVVEALAGREALQVLMNRTAAMLELRPASNLALREQLHDPEERGRRVASLSARLQPPSEGAPRTVILDSGVNWGNVLLRPALAADRCHTVHAGVDPLDWHGHGTQMAGLALFPDLHGALVDAGPVELATALESVVVIAPDAARRVAPDRALIDAVQAVEATGDRPRVYCLSATVRDDDNKGRQTGVSAALDMLAFGDGEEGRLFCVAGGNVKCTAYEPYRIEHYQGRNGAFSIETPGQAINALTVGACTHHHPQGFPRPIVAPLGDLCPTSRTSEGWSAADRYANKPDVVLEGGNHAVDPGGQTSRAHNDLQVLTTSRETPNRALTVTGESSAATAAAAGIATRLRAAYPQYRPETIRALIVHGARWTDAMLSHKADVPGKPYEQWEPVLNRFGWGMPDEQRATRSAHNALTLVVEDRLVPYKTNKPLKPDGMAKSSSVVLHEMKYFDLPWPRRALRALGNAEARLRVTLSYFAQPDYYGEARGRKDRYASHKLRFSVNLPGESAAAARARINAAVEAANNEEEVDDDLTWYMTGDEGWTAGARRRHLGSLHHDLWTGPAIELANRNGGISVYPAKGWWAGNPDPAIFGKPAPFSLVVSIETDAADVDLFAEIPIDLPGA